MGAVQRLCTYPGAAVGRGGGADAYQRWQLLDAASACLTLSTMHRLWPSQELQKRREEEQKLISNGSAPMLTLEEKRQQDGRSVDELLSFIENGGGGSSAATPRGSKKKKGKQSRKLSPSQVNGTMSADPLWVPATCQDPTRYLLPGACYLLRVAVAGWNLLGSFKIQMG